MGLEFRADKLKKPKNMIIMAEIICSFLCCVILSLWRGESSYEGVNAKFGYSVLPKGSYFGFLVAMTVCLLVAKALILLLKLINLQEKVPYFDVFNLFFSGAMVCLLGLSCILGAVAASENSKFWSKHTLPAATVFGWFALVALSAETVWCYLELRK